MVGHVFEPSSSFVAHSGENLGGGIAVPSFTRILLVDAQNRRKRRQHDLLDAATNGSSITPVLTAFMNRNGYVLKASLFCHVLTYSVQCPSASLCHNYVKVAILFVL